MKLYMKQKVFSWTDKFTVKGEDAQDKYYIEGEFFSWGKKLHVYDVSGREVAFIQQKVFSFLPKFFVFVDGVQVAEIVKEFTFFLPKYSITNLGWVIDGKFWEHDYSITKNGMPIVEIYKEWFTWGDSYVLDIANPADEVISLAVVIAIDCVKAAQAAANSSH